MGGYPEVAGDFPPEAGLAVPVDFLLEEEQAATSKATASPAPSSLAARRVRKTRRPMESS